MLNSLENLAKSHYENFPVGSFLLPKKYRTPIHLIYAFARVADDIADEGMERPAERLRRLDEWQGSLHEAFSGRPRDEFFRALAAAVGSFGLSRSHFDDLITAFREDADHRPYAAFDDVLRYCRFSANPIGRLMLELFGCANERTVVWSDHICTALQLMNFWQDISVDTGRNRFYICESDLTLFGLSRSDLGSNAKSESFRKLMEKNLRRTEQLFQDGLPLFTAVPKHFRFELRWVWHGGMRIGEKIAARGFDTRTFRPSLSLIDHGIIFTRALRTKEYGTPSLIRSDRKE